jgi:hypothetical protein
MVAIVLFKTCHEIEVTEARLFCRTMTCGLKPGSLNYESRDISLVASWVSRPIVIAFAFILPFKVFKVFSSRVCDAMFCQPLYQRLCAYPAQVTDHSVAFLNENVRWQQFDLQPVSCLACDSVFSEQSPCLNHGCKESLDAKPPNTYVLLKISCMMNWKERYTFQGAILIMIISNSAQLI